MLEAATAVPFGSPLICGMAIPVTVDVIVAPHHYERLAGAGQPRGLSRQMGKMVPGPRQQAQD